MTNSADSEPLVFELDLRNGQSHLVLIQEDEQHVEPLPQSLGHQVNKVAGGSKNSQKNCHIEGAETEAQPSSSQRRNTDSDSYDSGSSLFKTQRPLEVNRNAGRRSSIRHCISPAVSAQQRPRDGELSSDSGESFVPDSLRCFPLGRRRKKKKRKRKQQFTYKLTGKATGRHGSVSREQMSRIRKEKGIPFSFLEEEYGVNVLPHKMVLMYEQAALWGFFHHVQKMKFEHHLQNRLQILGSEEDVESRTHNYVDDGGPVSPMQVESEEDHDGECDQDDRPDAKVVDNSRFLLTGKPQRRKKKIGAEKEDAGQEDAKKQSAKRKAEEKKRPGSEGDGETRGQITFPKGQEGPSAEMVQEGGSRDKRPASVHDREENSFTITEKRQKKKRKGAKSEDAGEKDDKKQSKKRKANRNEGGAIPDLKGDDETQAERPVLQGQEESTEKTAQEGGSGDSGPPAVCDDMVKNCFQMMEKPHKKKKKRAEREDASKMNVEKQSGNAAAIRRNGGTMLGIEGEDGTQAKLPFPQGQEEPCEEIAQEGDRGEIGPPAVSDDMDKTSFLVTEKLKKKKKKKRAEREDARQMDAEKLGVNEMASRMNGGTTLDLEGDSETQAELSFPPSQEEPSEDMTWEDEGPPGVIDNMDSNCLMTENPQKKQKKKRRRAEREDVRGLDAQKQSGKEMGSRMNGGANPGQGGDNETQAELPFPQGQEESSKEMTQEGGSADEGPPVVSDDMDNICLMMEKPQKKKKKKRAEREDARKMDAQKQSGNEMASRINGGALLGLEGDNETQLELPFLQVQEEPSKEMAQEGGSGDEGPPAVSDYMDNNCLMIEKPQKKKKKKRAEREDTRKMDAQKQSGKEMASRMNGGAHPGLEGHNETQAELPFPQGQEEPSEEMAQEGGSGDEGPPAVSDDVDNNCLMMEKSQKKKKRAEREDSRKMDAQKQSGNEMAIRMNSVALPDLGGDNETQAELPFPEDQEDPSEEMALEGGSGDEGPPAVNDDVDKSCSVMTDTPRKKKKRKRAEREDARKQSGKKKVKRKNGTALLGLEEDIENQGGIPFHHGQVEPYEETDHEEGVGDQGPSAVHRDIVHDAADSESTQTETNDIQVTEKVNHSKPTSSDVIQPGNVSTREQMDLNICSATKVKRTKIQKRKLFTFQESDMFNMTTSDWAE